MGPGTVARGKGSQTSWACRIKGIHQCTPPGSKASYQGAHAGEILYILVCKMVVENCPEASQGGAVNTMVERDH